MLGHHQETQQVPAANYENVFKLFPPYWLLSIIFSVQVNPDLSKVSVSSYVTYVPSLKIPETYFTGLFIIVKSCCTLERSRDPL